MAHKDKDVKHVIILDEGPKAEEGTDEAYKLLREIDEYIGDEEAEDEKQAEKPKVKPVRVRRKKTIPSGLKKLLIALALSIVILAVVLVIAVGDLDAGYREPVKIYEEYLNTRDFDGEELSFAYANGLARHQFKALRDIQRNSPEYNDMLEASRLANAAAYDESCVIYGDGRKYSVTIDDTVPLTENELLVLTGDFEGLIRDLSSSSYASLTEPEVAGALAKLTAKVGDAHITRGYRLYCTVNVRGIKEDGPVSTVESGEFTVVRLNGHWIMWDKIYDIFRMTY